ncbi:MULTISPECIES: helix-turn-helix domain-containing protein [Kitasatospora]|uniref:Transcriptional regulator with XRE-family HTH domain n=2 Tax=Kitasatospora TaxID=2063 RepID=A0ABT1IQS9_9ACTN|nr:helix-turn-helix transcriptional regulator [Kitasatospora paracochleata]MCP2307364.1 transcriptional regulator with XRE-family HTH domain [Kitasatospora paracochleata]
MQPTEGTSDANTPARRFGAVVHEAAQRAGYDLRPGAGGRLALARDTGMSASAVGRMLRGETLPRPSQFQRIAQALDLDLPDLLVRGGVISEDSANDLSQGVRSPITPEGALDTWGITHPVIRRFLLASIAQAVALQRECETESLRGGTAHTRR